jgi:hypothetical protein
MPAMLGIASTYYVGFRKLNNMYAVAKQKI